MIGYRIEAKDGAIGLRDDLLMDDETWAIGHLVVAKRSWLPGRHVLASRHQVARIEPASGTVYLNVSRDAVRNEAAYP